MGMFDWVKFECDCPTCGTPVSGFQSKDGDCDMDHLATSQVNSFYSDCPNCSAWIEYRRKEPKVLEPVVKNDPIGEFDLYIDEVKI